MFKIFLTTVIAVVAASVGLSIIANQPFAVPTTPAPIIPTEQNLSIAPIPVATPLATSIPSKATTTSVTPQKKIAPKPIPVFVPPPIATTTPVATPVGFTVELPQEILVAKINEDEIQSAVVKVRCGNAFGSGFIRELNGKKYAITAAHVIIDQIDQQLATCDVIFPYKKPGYDFFEERYYRTGIIQATSTTKTNYTEKGLDIAALEVLSGAPAEDASFFPNGYPTISYPACTQTKPGDSIILFGYSVNAGTAATPGGIISRYTGSILQYGDVTSVTKKADAATASGWDYLPNLDYTLDTSLAHSHTVVATSNNFFGASGGLVFNTARNCIIGNNIALAQSSTQTLGIVINLNFNNSFINLLGK